MRSVFLAVFYLAGLLSLQMLYGQPPQSFNYQAVMRDSVGNILANHTVALRLSILDSSASGPAVYTESMIAQTNQFGLFNINIGTGNVVTGVFSAIDWAVSAKWLQVEMDISGGANFQLVSATQLVSVPYALYAAKSGYAANSGNTSLILSTLGDTIFFGNNYIIVPGVSMANACRMDFPDTVPYTLNNPHAGDFPYNSALYGLPKFISKNYIELEKIDSISRFRSGVGHDYSDSFELCRSMKHYFKPGYDEDWSSVKIFSPVNGIISDYFSEPIGGFQIRITPMGMPAFTVTIFHVNIDTAVFHIGDTIASGQQLGTHTGPQTMSDIAIQIVTPNSTFQRASFFEVMTDKLFACYMSRGASSRGDFIISTAERDADPLLPCNGQQFFVTGTINNWVTLY